MSEQAELSPEQKKPWFAIIAVSAFAVVAIVGITFRVLASGGEPESTAAAVSTVTTVTTAPASTTSTESTPTAEATPTETWAPYVGDLSALLLEIPAGAGAAQVAVTNAGQTTTITDDMPDIVRSATLWNPGQAEQIRLKFKSDGYVHGVMRAWEDGSGNLVIVDLMQFDRANGSASFLGWAVDGLYAGAYAQRGIISEVNSGKWAEYVFGDHRELRLLVGKGEFGIVLRVTSPGSANLDLLKALAIEQYHRLP